MQRSDIKNSRINCNSLDKSENQSVSTPILYLKDSEWSVTETKCKHTEMVVRKLFYASILKTCRLPWESGALCVVASAAQVFCQLLVAICFRPLWLSRQLSRQLSRMSFFGRRDHDRPQCWYRFNGLKNKWLLVHPENLHVHHGTINLSWLRRRITYL